MEETGKTNKEVAKTGKNFLEEAMSKNFDDLFNEDEKEVSKKIEFERKRKGKQVQLLAKINNLQMQVTDAETSFRKSLINPTMDSVALAIDIKALGEELKIAETVYNQLFPETALAEA